MKRNNYHGESYYINEYGMKSISRDGTEKSGIELGMVEVCHKVRKLAILDRLIVDKPACDGKIGRLNDYIVYCGMSMEVYIRQFLSNLQPYMIEEQNDDGISCVLDKAYKVSVRTESDATFGERAVVGFAEDNINDTADKTELAIYGNDRIVPVFADSIVGIDKQNGNTVVRVFAQKGMMALPLSVVGIECENFFIVREGDMETQLREYCEQYIRDLYTSNVDLDYDSVSVADVLKQIPFTSYGRDTFAALSLLMEAVARQQHPISRKAADYALVTFAGNLRLSGKQRQDLIEIIKRKYPEHADGDMDLIVDRAINAISVWE